MLIALVSNPRPPYMYNLWKNWNAHHKIFRALRARTSSSSIIHVGPPLTKILHPPLPSTILEEPSPRPRRSCGVSVMSLPQPKHKILLAAMTSLGTHGLSKFLYILKNPQIYSYLLLGMLRAGYQTDSLKPSVGSPDYSRR